MSTPQKPAPSVIFSSLLFFAGGVLLLIGLIDAVRQFGLASRHLNIIFLYSFLSLLCFFVSYGIYAHKKWALRAGFIFGFYLIINFLIDITKFSPLDIAILAFPIVVLISISLVSLYRKKHHFIH